MEKKDRGLKVGENRRENAGSKSKVQVGEEGVVLLKNNTNKKINFLLICYFLQERFPEGSLMFIPK